MRPGIGDRFTMDTTTPDSGGEGARRKHWLRGRSRLRLSLLIGLTIAAGLASRRFPSLVPDFLGKYPGDVLWAQMVFWMAALIWRRAPKSVLAIRAFAFCCVIESSQLYRADWILRIRATTPGHLVLGSTFAWLDLVAYALGILFCVVAEEHWPKLLRTARLDPRMALHFGHDRVRSSTSLTVPKPPQSDLG